MKIETQSVLNLLNSSENEYSKFSAKNDTLLTVNQKVISSLESDRLFRCICFNYRKYCCRGS